MNPTRRYTVVVCSTWLLLVSGSMGCRAARIPDRLAEIQTRPIPKTPQVLSEELAVMVEVDQKARFTLMEKGGGMPSIGKVRELMAIDHANTERMKRIVDELGWPTISKYGKQTSQHAWLLVQHADAQPEFQRRCLDLMKPLVELGEVSKKEYAYLTDRVLLAEGKPQIYGTQFHTVGGVSQPRPLVDPENVDQRRKEMGMMPLEEYKKLLEN